MSNAGQYVKSEDSVALSRDGRTRSKIFFVERHAHIFDLPLPILDGWLMDSIVGWMHREGVTLRKITFRDDDGLLPTPAREAVVEFYS